MVFSGLKVPWQRPEHLVKALARFLPVKPSWYPENCLSWLKDSLIADANTIVMMEEIPAELTWNWDNTECKFVPCSTCFETARYKASGVIGVKHKHQITAALCSSLSGDFLHVQLMYKVKTSHCHPQFAFLLGFYITLSPNPWSTQETMLQYIEWWQASSCHHMYTISRGRSQSPSSVSLMPTTSTLAICHQILLIVSSSWTLLLTN